MGTVPPDPAAVSRTHRRADRRILRGHRSVSILFGEVARIDAPARTVHLTLPVQERVFALGDLAACAGGDARPLPGLARVARQQGIHPGRTLAAHLIGRRGPRALPLRKPRRPPDRD